MSIQFVITSPQGMLQHILARSAMLEVGLESEQEFSRLMVEVAEGRADIESMVEYLASSQTYPDAKQLARDICMESVARMMAELSCVRSDTGFHHGTFYFDQWTAQGDLQLAHHA